MFKPVNGDSFQASHRESVQKRPMTSDLLGAGAVISRLQGSRSSEAASAARDWKAARDHDVTTELRECGSGRELQAKGHGDDVAYAGEVGTSTVVPVLLGGRFISAGEASDPT